jgi:hypothetical protein
MLNKKNLHGFLALLSMAMLSFVVIIHIRFVILPVFFLALGMSTGLWSGRKALVLFLFLLPLINSTPDIFSNGYPFNYMGIALFYLSGILIASRLKKEKPAFVFPGYGLYLLFLVLISISVFFVFLRWSNLTLSPLAFLRDTPVAPSGERLSFACIFPVITLALFSLTPFLASMLRYWKFKENEIFIPLKAGFCLSFLLALVQKLSAHDFMAQDWWRLKINQVNGGFSDFNAFGFFAGVMFLYQALQLTDKLPGSKAIATHDKTESSGRIPRLTSSAGLGLKILLPGILFLMTTEAAIFLSGCRTAFLFVLLAVIYLIFSKKITFLIKALVILLLAISFFAAGGTLKKRLQQTVVQTAGIAAAGGHKETADQTARISTAADPFGAVDKVGSGRLAMLRDSVRMIARFPVSGVGAGNFLFYLKYFHFGDNAYMDLPLNQYLLIFSETGLAAGLLFILFLVVLLKRQVPGIARSVLAAIAFALFFNNFFWFPECLLLFWIFLAGNDCRGVPETKSKHGLAWALVIVFIAFNVLDFRALHPQNLNRQKGVAYDYGFWPGEKNKRGQFSWTGQAAGKYFPDYAARGFALFCEAPQDWLRKKNITVELFWRAKLFKKLVFNKNRFEKFKLPHRQRGFLEIRVHPTFNTKALNLGADARELGVQFMDLEKPLP